MGIAAERWQRVRELFEQALALGPQLRGRFLDEECGADSELRAEVESLLAHDAETGEDFLAPLSGGTFVNRRQAGGAASDGVGAEADALIGTQIGQYLVRDVIASGGMGTVYEAEQERPHRIVALKAMSRGLGSPAAVRRFRAEAEFLAHLRHPNIAHVYEAGMHGEGPRAAPYFAMELVQWARTITRFADEKHLDARARLALFAKVCDAVHHGHQKGVIHRDLKPGNILVDAVGEPKVIDFGVARATDVDLAVTQQTAVGDLIGTMQYMSPEQCDANPAELDTRSDVYSLGVVLYELLTGALPYDATNTTIYGATRTIKETLPKPPAKLVPKLRGDIETIVLKALEKDRTRRYQSAAQLADDIRHVLNREPISARPPTGWTKTLRWIGRHPVWTTAVACVVMVVAAGLGAVIASDRVAEFYARLPVRLDRRYNDVGGIREANILARSGAEIWSWRPRGTSSEIVYADLHQRPDAFGGGTCALIGLSRFEDLSYGNSVALFDFKLGFEKPIWHAKITEDSIPDRLRKRTAAEGKSFAANVYTAGAVLVADVFSGATHPGEEIVVALRHKGGTTQSTLCVFDFDGQPLYQTWADFQFNQLGWMSGPQLLVCAGINGAYLWSDREYDSELTAETCGAHPKVVMGLRLQPGLMSREFIEEAPGDGPLKPAWVRCVLPPKLGVIFGITSLNYDDPTWDRATTFQLGFHEARMPQLLGFSLIVDQHGNVVAGPNGNNFYNERVNLNLDSWDPRWIPSASAESLGDLPPPKPDARRRYEENYGGPGR